jgi:hypothetical protein
MMIMEKLRAIDWTAVWREVSDTIDRMPRERNGMPDHSLDRLLATRAPRRAPSPAPTAAPPPPKPDSGLRHRTPGGN